MERFLTYIIVAMAMGCMFFVFVTQERRKDENVTVVQTIDDAPATYAQEHTDQDMEEDNIPLENMRTRVIIKPFGIFVTPKNSPVNPERFSGYHTGVDVEVFDDERGRDVDVIVHAICDGEISAKDTISGYGGVVIQTCMIDKKKVHVIYGHMRLASVQKATGVAVERGEEIGVLGTGMSAETDYERKHLHLGIYKGDRYSVRGYVQRKEDLLQWIDPCTIVHCGK